MCFLTLTEKNMSKRIIFSYLEDIKNTFIAYLQNENKEESFHSSLFTHSWRTALATMAVLTPTLASVLLVLLRDT